MLLIIFCAGCHAVEDFVINLIHILRLNGVDAVSEITEEEKVQKFGRGVYLNDRLKDADFVMVLCTEGNFCIIILVNSFWVVQNFRIVRNSGNNIPVKFMVLPGNFTEYYTMNKTSFSVNACYKSFK